MIPGNGKRRNRGRSAIETLTQFFSRARLGKAPKQQVMGAVSGAFRIANSSKYRIVNALWLLLASRYRSNLPIIPIMNFGETCPKSWRISVEGVHVRTHEARAGYRLQGGEMRPTAQPNRVTCARAKSTILHNCDRQSVKLGQGIQQPDCSNQGKNGHAS